MKISQTRVTVKNVKIAKFASEETLCMRADVYFDGDMIATAENNGHGGSTFVRAFPKTHDAVRAAEAYAKTLPEWDLGQGQSIPMTLDLVVDDLVEKIGFEADCRRLYQRVSKQRVLFTRPDSVGILQTATVKKMGANVTVGDAAAALRKRLPEGSVILNDLPLSRALEIFMAAQA